MSAVRLPRDSRVVLLHEQNLVRAVPRRRPIGPFEADEGLVVAQVAAQEGLAVQIGDPDLRGRPEAEHNQRVRRLAAAAMLVLFASLNAIDGICCPDGCTYEQGATSQHDRESSDGACVLCLGGVESAVPQVPSGCGIVTNRFATSLYTHHLDAQSDPPDHPPRS